MRLISTCVLAFLFTVVAFAQKENQTSGTMIKVYVMKTCPDCDKLKSQLESDARFEVIDIGTHVRRLKEFVRLRDTHPAFADFKKTGTLGIPCFVQADGTVTFDAEDVGLKEEVKHTPQSENACRLDGSGC